MGRRRTDPGSAPRPGSLPYWPAAAPPDWRAEAVSVSVSVSVSVQLSPLTRTDTASMLRELRSFPLLDGYRGGPKCDIAALEDVLLRISALVEDHPHIAEMDCNPVMVSASGAVVVDARVKVAPVAPRRPLGARRS